MAEAQVPFHCRRRVAFGDTDMVGIVHFAKFFEYMEDAEHEFLRSRGVALFAPIEGGAVSWPRVSVRCDFASPARFEDMLDIEVIVQNRSAKAVTYGFRITVGDRLVATGQTVAVCCRIDRAAGVIRSIEIPADIAGKLCGAPASPA